MAPSSSRNIGLEGRDGLGIGWRMRLGITVALALALALALAVALALTLPLAGHVDARGRRRRHLARAH